LNLFEVGDVILKAKNEVGSRNERRLACIHTNENTSGFEVKLKRFALLLNNFNS